MAPNYFRVKPTKVGNIGDVIDLMYQDMRALCAGGPIV